MYEYIKGKLTEASPVKITVEAGGIGYSLFISLSTYAKLPPIGENIFCFVAPVIREDSHRLFGFLTREERTLFEKLTDISGIGPKTSLSILGHLPMNELCRAVEEDNINLLIKVPGIGRKTAERLIIEMRDKIKNLADTKIHAQPKKEGIFSDAVSALIHLGYSNKDAQISVKKVFDNSGKEPTLSETITLALKIK